MTNIALFAEQQVRADLARLLLAAVEASGRARCDIARDAQIHKAVSYTHLTLPTILRV